MREFKVKNIEKNQRLDMYLSNQFDEISRSKLKKMIIEGNVTVNGELKKPKYFIQEDDNIKVNISIKKDKIDIKPENIYLDIVYEDEYLAIINKQANLTVHPTLEIQKNTLVNGLLNKFEKISDIDAPFRYGIVHRLDKDTTGLIIIAKDNKTHELIQKMFKDKSIKKRYLAIVNGRITEPGTINKNIGRHPKNRVLMTVLDNGRESITHYRPMDYNENHTLLDIDLETGRTHQIRVHMKYIHHNIVGDKFYGLKKENIKASRQMLHAYKLEFEHPITKEFISVTKFPTEEFETILKKCKLKIQPN